VEAAKSTWTRYDLAREITRAMPASPGLNGADRLARIDLLVSTAVDTIEWGVVGLAAPAGFATPPVLRRGADGLSVYEPHGAHRYTTRAALAAEERVLAAASTVGARRVDPDVIEATIATAGLGVDQAAATRTVLTSGRRLEVIVGPAGTGKTTTMRAVARAWRDSGGTVLGVSISENASHVLAGNADIRAVNSAKFVFEHTRRTPAEKTERWWQAEHALGSATLVILDEASMASTATLDQMQAICAAADAKLLLVGDPEQLGSPEAGGGLDLIIRRAGATGRSRSTASSTPGKPPPVSASAPATRACSPSTTGGHGSWAAPATKWKTPPSPPPSPTGPADGRCTCWSTPTRPRPAWPAATVTISSPSEPSTTTTPSVSPTETGPESATAS
jgi:Mrp family chromosome partitioning ATPase